MRFIVFLLALWAVPAFAGPPPGPDVQQVQVAETVMQCMERCIRSEGKEEKSTCKTRCAKVGTQGRPQKDCGTMYKTCMKGCGKDKNCTKACRKARTKCF